MEASMQRYRKPRKHRDGSCHSLPDPAPPSECNISSGELHDLIVECEVNAPLSGSLCKRGVWIGAVILSRTGLDCGLSLETLGTAGEWLGGGRSGQIGVRSVP